MIGYQSHALAIEHRGHADALDARDRHPYEKTVGRLRAHPETFFRSHLCAGVTGVFDVGGYAWTVALTRMTEGLPFAAMLDEATPERVSALVAWLASEACTLSGEVIAGSKTEPVKFEEYWTFTRPVGNNPWRLSAINQAG